MIRTVQQLGKGYEQAISLHGSMRHEQLSSPISCDFCYFLTSRVTVEKVFDGLADFPVIRAACFFNQEVARCEPCLLGDRRCFFPDILPVPYLRQSEDRSRVEFGMGSC